MLQQLICVGRDTHTSAPSPGSFIMKSTSSETLPSMTHHSRRTRTAHRAGRLCVRRSSSTRSCRRQTWQPSARCAGPCRPVAAEQQGRQDWQWQLCRKSASTNSAGLPWQRATQNLPGMQVERGTCCAEKALRAAVQGRGRQRRLLLWTSAHPQIFYPTCIFTYLMQIPDQVSKTTGSPASVAQP